MKLCNKCGLHKPADKKNFTASDGYLCSPCNECRNTSRRERKRANPEKYKRGERLRSVKFEYGLDEKGLSALERKSQGRCEICATPFSDLPRAADIDHCHTTQKVRGMLCSNCNTGIGLLKDDVQIMESAIRYIERSLFSKLEGEVDWSQYLHLVPKHYRP